MIVVEISVLRMGPSMQVILTSSSVSLTKATILAPMPSVSITFISKFMIPLFPK